VGSIATRLSRLEHLQHPTAPSTVVRQWKVHAFLAQQGIVQPPATPEPHAETTQLEDRAFTAWVAHLPERERALCEAWLLVLGLRDLPEACKYPDSEQRVLTFLRDWLERPDAELASLDEEAYAMVRRRPWESGEP
jgi:hypothetical protein